MCQEIPASSLSANALYSSLDQWGSQQGFSYNVWVLVFFSFPLQLQWQEMKGESLHRQWNNSV
jgi:hypothetical protein